MKLAIALIILGVLLLALGCASHYIAADKDMSRMPFDKLIKELAKPI